ncbi:MAG: amidohydrolase [Desulfobacterales bacterium]|jgi:5-methylthioadenosine/S-adenosylhomocysteine deaminase
MLDTLFHNATVVTAAADFAVFQEALVGVRAGRIERIETAPVGATLPRAKETVDAGGGLILPGLVNTHTHLPMSLFRGLADDLPLQQWLSEHIFPAEAKHIDPEAVRLGASLAAAELLLSGTTTCCDGYFYETEAAEAVERMGLRAVMGQGVIDFPAPGVPDPSRNIDHAEDFLRRWKNAADRIRPSIFCHSPYTCSSATLIAAKKAASRHGVLFQIHVAETRMEADQIRAEHNLSPVAYLDRLGVLDADTLIVHGVWLDGEDIDLLAARGCPVSHNPQSNMKLASGVAPVAKMLQAGIRVGLGTDGCASNNDLDLFAEMDTAAKLHKAVLLDPTVLGAEQVLAMATCNGARAIGWGDEIGSVEVGKAADLIVLDTAAPHLMPMYRPVSHLVYAARGSDVRDVMVGGRFVVRDRKLLTADVEELMDRVAVRCRTIGTSSK